MQRTVRSRYEAMRAALNATGRPILFQMCEWGVSSPWLYGSQVIRSLHLAMQCSSCSFPAQPRCDALQVGNTWRTTQDISMSITATWDSIMNNLDGSTGLARFAGQGGWNDMDLMEVGGCPAHLPWPSSLLFNLARPPADRLAGRGSADTCGAARTLWALGCHEVAAHLWE